MDQAALDAAPSDSAGACASRRPYAPRRPEHASLYRVLADQFDTLERVHEERFESAHGPLRAAARAAVGRFLDCGLLEHGFARVRCATCRAEFLVAFRCKGRHFCPSCHARRLAEWSLWLDEQLLARVPHRQVVLTLPKRLRPYFVHDRRRLGELSRLGYHTLRDYLGAALGARAAAPGALVCVQSFGAVLNWHPHLHVLMTDGVFARDGTFTRAPAHDAAVLEQLWQRAVLAWFVAAGWLEAAAAAAMLAWPHTGFGAHLGPVIAGEDRASLLRVARYGARAPVAEGRLRYEAARAEIELVSDARGGPYVGVQRMTALEFVARWVRHVPEPYETRVRYYGAYAHAAAAMVGAAWGGAGRHHGDRAVGGRDGAEGRGSGGVAGAAGATAALGGVAAAGVRGRGGGVPALRRGDADRGLHDRAGDRTAAAGAQGARRDRGACRAVGGARRTGTDDVVSARGVRAADGGGVRVDVCADGGPASASGRGRRREASREGARRGGRDRRQPREGRTILRTTAWRRRARGCRLVARA